MSRMTAPAEADIPAASRPALDAAAHQLGYVRKKQMAADRFRVSRGNGRQVVVENEKQDHSGNGK